ncbi:MAG: ROK family transcriptional regulator [Victivallales bacterium]|nr:ROK family transcriptional regulator [Victivallales bacterium]
MPQNKILTLSDLKARHTLLVLDTLRRHDGLSRMELARVAGCDNTTVTRAIRDLMACGLVVSTGKSGAAKGRPREHLTLNTDGPRIIGLAIEPGLVSGALVDMRGGIHERECLPYSGTRDTRSLFRALTTISRHLMSLSEANLLGMGVSTFGAGADAAHLDLSAHFPNLGEVDLRGFFLKGIGMIPQFADMLRCRMQYELGRMPELRDGTTMLVWLDSGIGMNLAVGGQLLPGHLLHGGELGHNVCEPNGLLCACGRRGCLETRCSTGAVLAAARQISGRTNLSFAQLCALCEAGEPRLNEITDHVAHFLGTALANQLNNLNVRHLVLAGGLLQLGGVFRNRLESAIRELLFPVAASALHIHFREQDDDGLLLGAAFLVQERLFSDPDFLASRIP